MTSWLTSDLHFGHTNIIQFCGRPYGDTEEMNDDLVRRYNEVVDADDDVWIVGDLCMGRLEISLMWVEQLNGKKHLIPGNHDRMFGCQGTKYAHMVQKYLDRGIATVEDEQVTLNIGDQIVTACHFPYVGDSKAKDGHEDRFQEKRPKDYGQWLVHGHTHGLWRRNGRMIDIGVDSWGGYPVSFEAVAKLLDLKEVTVPLHW